MAIHVAIEGYDSLEQIGIGGMAAVYRARKVSIDKTVAIKVLFPYLATDESYIERFQREAKAAASIQHENIVNVIDFGESDGSFFIVMEYYDGRTLEQLMIERPGLPPEIAVQILLEVAYGLEAAHALDIVHRDIKPANLIYTNQGGIKIADFGLARKSDSMTMITQHGKVLGTPAYMSPEQAAGRPVGPASDIFSFGVVAYELLGRKKPFQGRSYSDVLDKIQTQDPPPVSIANPLVPPEFERIVQRALAKDAEARYRSAGELITDLEAAMEANHIARDRRRLVSYAKDPDQHDAAFAETTITQCLSRGAFFMQKGNTHLKDAVLEYRRVLFLDPGHERARANLAKLRSEDQDDARPRTTDTATPAANVATRMVPARAVPAPAARRKLGRRAYAAAAAIVIAGSAAVYWAVFSPRDTDHASTPPTLGAEVPDSAPMERVATRMSRADSPRMLAGDAHRETMAASTTGAGATSPVDARERKKEAAPVKATARAPSDAGASGAVAPAPARESAPAPGTLSVFYLGGVGELWVDGKLFSQQPPFEGASIAAGVHRVACRMGGDESRREFTVTIRSGVETVIEYEVGGSPVVVKQ